MTDVQAGPITIETSNLNTDAPSVTLDVGTTKVAIPPDVTNIVIRFLHKAEAVVITWFRHETGIGHAVVTTESSIQIPAGATAVHVAPAESIDVEQAAAQVEALKSSDAALLAETDPTTQGAGAISDPASPSPSTEAPVAPENPTGQTANTT